MAYGLDIIVFLVLYLFPIALLFMWLRTRFHLISARTELVEFKESCKTLSDLNREIDDLRDLRDRLLQDISDQNRSANGGTPQARRAATV